MLILHIPAASRAALLLCKVMALKRCPHGCLKGGDALAPAAARSPMFRN